MERLINRRRQGDLGEASAIEWLTRRGANVYLPLGHSPDVDLVAEINRNLLRVQVKTSVYAPNDRRWSVAIRTNGGNQSWTGTSKLFDPSTVDYLFVLVGDGRRWFIPAAAVESATTLSLGGTKYAEYEIDPTKAILPLVLGGREDPSKIVGPNSGEYPRGQRMAAVNGPVQPSQVRLLPPPLSSSRPIKPTRYERKLGQNGQAVINQKRRITIPQRPFFEAGFVNGGRVRVRSEGHGRVVIEQIELPSWAA